MEPLIVAAIDVGSSSIRMDISEIREDGTFRILDSLNKGIALGKDAFTAGQLSEETIQTACQALIDFRHVMNTYKVARYRAVATSAVREATNADMFLDRAYLRSSIDIEVIDGSEENRLMYLAIANAIQGIPELQEQDAIVVEIGGGSTDISFLKAGELVHSGTFALGSVRLRQEFARLQGDGKQKTKVLDRQIKNVLNSVALTIPFGDAQQMIAIGGDIRFAARHLGSGPAGEPYSIIPKKDFVKFCNDIMKLETDDLVRQYKIGYPQAETMVPALLGYRNILDRTKSERLHVVAATLRAGILLDTIRTELGTGIESFERQIIASSRSMAKKYHSNENHVEQVRTLSMLLFDQLTGEHGLGRRERLFLEVAALLHDVGSFIGNRGHHKHTYYIIASTQIFGLTQTEVNLIANVARYHRRSMPKASHVAYVSLDRESRMIVSKLAALLRVADSLDQDHTRKIREIRLVADEESGRYTLEAISDGDLAIERLSLERKSDLFKAIYGKPIVLSHVDRFE